MLNAWKGERFLVFMAVLAELLGEEKELPASLLDIQLGMKSEMTNDAGFEFDETALSCRSS